MENEELNKKLAKWGGFRYKPDELCGDSRSPHIKHSYGWQAPNEIEWKQKPPHFTESLDACFKWLLPKYVMQTGRDFVTLPTTLTLEETALKLCQMIEQLIKEK